jgi:hypothetical protein
MAMDKELAVLLLRVTSGLCWTAVYVRIIAAGARDKTCGMPVLALAANLAWEGVFGYLLDYGPQAHVQQRTNQVWFLCDAGIAFLYVRYGNPGELFPSAVFGRAWWLGLATLTFGAVMYRAAVEHGVQPAARPTALVQNLVMSILFIEMMRRSGSTQGQAVDIAVLKLVGTVAAVIFLTLNTGSGLIAVIGVPIAGYDIAYVAMLAAARRRVGAAVSTPLPAITARPIVQHSAGGL